MREESRLKNNMVTSMLRGNAGIIAVLLIIGVALSFLSPYFLTYDNLISVLRQISNNIYLALGMTMVIILGGIYSDTAYGHPLGHRRACGVRPLPRNGRHIPRLYNR